MASSHFDNADKPQQRVPGISCQTSPQIPPTVFFDNHTEESVRKFFGLLRNCNSCCSAAIATVSHEIGHTKIIGKFFGVVKLNKQQRTCKNNCLQKMNEARQRHAVTRQQRYIPEERSNIPKIGIESLRKQNLRLTFELNIAQLKDDNNTLAVKELTTENKRKSVKLLDLWEKNEYVHEKLDEQTRKNDELKREVDKVIAEKEEASRKAFKYRKYCLIHEKKSASFKRQHGIENAVDLTNDDTSSVSSSSSSSLLIL